MGRVGHKAETGEGELSGWLWQEDFEHFQRQHEVFLLKSRVESSRKSIPPFESMKLSEE